MTDDPGTHRVGGMQSRAPSDFMDLIDQLVAAERDAEALVAGSTWGVRRPG